MNTHIGFYEDLTKIISQLSSNIDLSLPLGAYFMIVEG